MSDAESSGNTLGLAVWDAIADILHRRTNDVPEPAQGELKKAADALRESATSFLFADGGTTAWALYPFARDMAFAVLDWWNSPSEENFKKLQHASRRFEQERVK